MIKAQIDKLYKKICRPVHISQYSNGRQLKKADMHIHTFFSKENLPGGKYRHKGYEKPINLGIFLLFLYKKIFISKKFSIPDLKNYELCFHLPVPPKQAYDTAVRRGMHFIPITDHDSVEGAFEIIKKYPYTEKRVIIGEEVSSELEGQKIHVGVYGIDQRQHDEIQSRKKSAKKLVNYLRNQDILFAINHISAYEWGQKRPISQNYIRKCLELFDVFEARNGLVAEPNNKITEVLAKLYGKGVIAGSDSHSVREGQTYTAAYAKSKEDFIEQIKRKNSYIFGAHGGSDILSKEFFANLKRYDNIHICGQKLMHGCTWVNLHKWAFNKIGNSAHKRLKYFLGGSNERENAKTVYEYVRRNSALL
jgi:predicted metal-dependent phosphoesterase TrpH